MSHDEIRAALAAATPGPWDAKPLGSEGYAVTGAPDPDAPGVRAKMRRRIARFGYQDWDTDRANAELVAKAPTWLAELLAEVDRLTALTSPRKAEAMASLVKASTRLVQIERDDARARAEAAEQAVQRVRELAESWATQPNDYDEDTEQQIEDGNAILRALDGGE